MVVPLRLLRAEPVGVYVAYDEAEAGDVDDAPVVFAMVRKRLLPSSSLVMRLVDLATRVDDAGLPYLPMPVTPVRSRLMCSPVACRHAVPAPCLYWPLPVLPPPPPAALLVEDVKKVLSLLSADRPSSAAAWCLEILIIH